jgi:cysteine-rich repeat protein
MADECDNGLGVKNDGCSDTCKQEVNFVCVNKSANVSGEAVKLSTCSYNRTLDIKLLKI